MAAVLRTQRIRRCAAGGTPLLISNRRGVFSRDVPVPRLLDPVLPVLLQVGEPVGDGRLKVGLLLCLAVFELLQLFVARLLLLIAATLGLSVRGRQGRIPLPAEGIPLITKPFRLRPVMCCLLRGLDGRSGMFGRPLLRRLARRQDSP